MGARSFAEQIPEDIRQWLEAQLLESGFSGYLTLTEELNAKLAERGVEITVGKSSVHRFGSKFEERCAALKRSTEIAQTMAREVGDDEGALSDAILRVTQNKLFNLVLDMEVEPDTVSLPQIGRVVADLARASVTQKRHQLAVRAAVETKLASLEAESKGGKTGLDAETLRRVREEIYGVI